MSIQKKLNDLKPYVVGIRFKDGLTLIEANLKETWVVAINPKYKHVKLKEDENYNIFYSEDESVSVDDLLEFVKSVIDSNIEKEKKLELLRIKVKELEGIFKKNSLTDLNKLKFVIPKEEKPLNVDVQELIDVDSFNKDDEEEPVEVKNEPVAAPKIEESQPVDKEVEKFNRKNNTIKNGNEELELPPKGDKIEVEVFEPTVTSVCNCGPSEACEVCLEY